MTSVFVDMASLSNFFDVALFLLSRLVTGLSFMSKSSQVLHLWQLTRLTRNQEIGKTPRLSFAQYLENVSYEILLNTSKCKGYSFYHFWVIKGKTNWCRGEEGGEVKITPSPPRLGLKARIGMGLFFCFILCIIPQDKMFFCYILLTDHVLLSGCLCFVKYWTKCVL